MAKTPPKIDIVKHPEFRVIYASGFFGTVNALEGQIKFYLDIAEPRIKAGGKPGEMELDKITRELEVEIRMSPVNFVAMCDWMKTHIDRLEKAGILEKGKKPKKDVGTYRV